MCCGAMLEEWCSKGVGPREIGELEPSEPCGECLLDGLRWFDRPGGGVPASDLEEAPLPLRDGWIEVQSANFNPRYVERKAYPLLPLSLQLPLARCFDAIATFDHIGFEANGSWCAMKFQEKATCVAENRADLISTPKWCG